ncbi:SGNH/GDSL hydrolase family protein [Solirubrobacter deserti]|uniref:SGNH/GDSL hydrolase family protein n=1 Tax=Solirubrobacter deserti TaxID=2282478 RepID=A0ABT4RTX7_9ACTN|nr:SGNH/GDSL hydrolase family protein [Solirubrobacter deserti]MDA0142034.1 SGNH/GDSL hydrolase family protein [Solirubrobacter deserti]
MHTLRAFAAVAATIGALAVAPASANAAYWVGLGDSFAAGPLIPSQTLNPLGCLRSTRNYARQASAQLGVSLRDVSCSGAETAEMTTSQETYAGTNPPQLDAIAADTRVVSLQIGGNDIGFTEILTNCQTANPFGRPCQDRYVRNGVDELRRRIGETAPKVAAVLRDIKARSLDRARIVVLNYEAILPSSGSGCWPQVPLAWADVPYVRGIQLELNAMIARQVTEANREYGPGVRLADTYTASLGKDACKGSGTRWLEPLVPGNAAAPFHPNARGMTGVTPTVVAAAS